MIARFLLELLSILSRFINVLSGHTADLTFSARSHRDGLRTERWIDAVAWRVFGERDHCRVWWLREVERSQRNVAAAVTGASRSRLG